MVSVGRVVSLLVSLPVFHFSLAAGHNFKMKGIGKAYIMQRRRNHERDPVSFVCTNKANYEGDTRNPSVTTGQIQTGTTGPSSTKGSSLEPDTSSDRINKQSASSNSSTGSYSPSDGVTESTQSRRCSTLPPTSFEAPKEVTEKFIFTFLAVKCTNSTTEIFIGTKSCDVGASGNISFPLKDVPTLTFSLNPGSGEIFVVPSNAVPSKSELNQKVNTSVVITSDEEVVVYGHQRCHGPGNHRATAFRVRRIEDLGTDYWVITHQSGGNSQFGVVATKDHTNISFNGVFINKTLNLNKYESFYFGGSYDLTGTYIVADKPIFVIAGNSADKSPYPNTSYIDSFNKCLPPVKDWGRHFTLVPFLPESQPFTAKILSSHDNCTLEYQNGTGSHDSVSLNKGEVEVVNSSTVLNISSSQGILVAQFSKGRSGYRRYGNPSMLLTPHYGDAGRNEFIFPVFRLSADNGDETSYITIWLPPESEVLLDNKTVSWNEIGEGTDGYKILQTTLSSHGFHIIHSSTNITAVVCGIGDYKYYSYSLY